MQTDRWARHTFGELIDGKVLFLSDGYRAKNQELGGDGLIFLRAGHVTDSHIELSGVERFGREMSLKLQSKVSRPSDVMVTTKGNSTGRVGYVTDDLPPFVYSPHLSFWRSLRPDKLVPGFLRAWSKGPEFQHQLKALSHGTDMAPYLSLVDQKRLRISLPPVAEQRAIAHILGSLDDKIELNRRLNQTLEEIARALFTSWFVRFDPVRAKAAGCQPEGMDAETAALFPSVFEDSALGPIPKGWSWSTLGAHFKITMGQSPPGSSYNQQGCGLPFYQGRADFGPRFPRRRVFCTAPTRLANHGDTLVSVRAPVGDINMAGERCAIGRGVAAVRHSAGCGSYTYQVLRHLQPSLRRYDTEGTVFGAINKQAFHRLPVLAPPAAIVQRFEVLSAPIDRLIEHHEMQSQNLIDMRDSVLPKLLSGDLRVSQAELEMGQVL